LVVLEMMLTVPRMRRYPAVRAALYLSRRGPETGNRYKIDDLKRP
jgi:hypothetical protein